MQKSLNSIQGRLTAIALFFIIATSVAMGVAGFNLTLNFERMRFRDHFELLASYLASNAELGVLLGNENLLGGLTENMLAVADVFAVEILGRNDELILRRAQAKQPATPLTVAAPVVSRSMGSVDSPFLAAAGETEEVGRVIITYSLDGMEQFKKMLARRFLLISLILAVAPVAMYWLLSRAISSPLQELLAVAGQVSRGRMDVRARGGSLAETRTLAAAINEMLTALESQRRKLNEAHETLSRQQALAEVGKFSMIVAHEIKNPLAIIKGSLDVLRKEGALPTPTKSRLMGFLDDEIERINKLIEDFLLFARPGNPVMRPVELSELIAALGRRIRLMQGDLSVDLAVTPILPGRQLRCDPHLLERALLNVVRNALDVVPPSAGEIRVRVVVSERCLALVILDNGPGLAAESRADIFNPFFSTKSKGTGLGLAIARDIIEAHGGSITAANRRGGGACFTVSLPL